MPIIAALIAAWLLVLAIVAAACRAAARADRELGPLEPEIELGQGIVVLDAGAVPTVRDLRGGPSTNHSAAALAAADV